MIFLPIVGRELRVAARRRGTHRVRFFVALLAILFCGWFLLMSDSRSGGARSAGPDIFFSLSLLAFGYCLLAGVGATADCLSEEKREGTLGLLFLTDLRGYDIVSGKLAATSLGAVYGLVAILPVMALPLLMGGVGPGAFWRTALTLVNTLFFSLAAGMFVSAVSRDERRAIVGTIGLILLISALLPLAGAMWDSYHDTTGRMALAPYLFLPSPGYALALALESATSPKTNPAYWHSMLVVHGLAWAFLLLAVWLVPHAWVDHTVRTDATGWRTHWQRWLRGSLGAHSASRTRLLELSPVAWLSCRNRLTALAPWIVMACLAVVWLMGYARMETEWLALPTAATFALMLHGFLKCQLAGDACRRFAEDRRSGALELLLTTPLGVKEILRGQARALRRQFAAPVVAVLAADTLLLLGALGETGMTNGDASGVLLTFLAGMAVLVADAVTLSYLGMWRALRAASFTRAWGETLGLVLVLPWAVFLVAAFTAEAVGLAPPNHRGWLFVWLGLGIGWDAVLLGWARWKLATQFRAVAAARSRSGFGRRRG
jgi:hypothetical protein